MSSCCPPTAHPFKKEAADYVPQGKMIEFNGVQAYVTGETNTHSGKAIVVGYEVFGLKSGRLREICDYFASLGYYVILADYHRGNYLRDFSELGEWLNKNQLWVDSQVKGVADNVVKHLVERGIKSIGVLGFCWGTWLGVKIAQTYPGLVKAIGGAHPAHSVIMGALGEDATSAFSSISKVPVIVLAAGDDRSDEKPGASLQAAHNNSDDVFQEYKDQKHGWVTRGDLKDAVVQRDFDAAISQLSAFYQKHV